MEINVRAQTAHIKIAIKNERTLNSGLASLAFTKLPVLLTPQAGAILSAARNSPTALVC